MFFGLILYRPIYGLFKIKRDTLLKMGQKKLINGFINLFYIKKLLFLWIVNSLVTPTLVRIRLDPSQ